ncbi:MAG: hypothetical protein Kow0027_04580 [Saprospiraceae bacterium]
MKLMFLQDFHMDAKGGGTYILRRLHKYAPEYGVEPFYVYDTNGEGLYESGEYPSTAFSTRRRQYRFGLGRLAGFATIAGFDYEALKRLRQIIAEKQPDAFHVTTHGVSFPIMAKAAFETGRPVYLSVHDLWHQTVRPYIPESLSHGIFGRIARRAKEIFVVSDEMGEYLRQLYGIQSWKVVHDGVTNIHERRVAEQMPETIRLLYVGMVHSRQMKMLHQLVRCLGAFTDRKFEVHFCTRTPYTPEVNPDNVEIIFHGWLSEEELVALSHNSHMGLLPLSFEPEDALFYRTSFMTKITFYTSVSLPILCFGPEWASATRIVREDGLGLTFTENSDEAVTESIRQMLNLTTSDYQRFIENMKSAAASRFDAATIAHRFFSSMGMTKGINGHAVPEQAEPSKTPKQVHEQ